LSTTLVAIAPVPQAGDDLALSIPAETLRQRADVRAAEFLAKAELARLGQAKAARWPSFALGGSLGLNSLTPGTLTDRASVVSTLLASVSVPLIDFGALRAAVGAQRAVLEQTQQRYRAAILNALLEVEDALVALRDDRLRFASLQRAAASASSAALMARQRYSSGLVDYQTVLDTQRSQLTAQDSEASANADISADHVRLYRALGGGWNADKLTSSATGLASYNRPTP
jgi:outer membrane protein TolC